MNNLRMKGNIFINEFNFNNISNAIKTCINNIETEKNQNKKIGDWGVSQFDYESMNLVLIISTNSTNLYKINEFGNKPRMFLQEKLSDILLFSEFDFWKNIIRYFIINEMHSQKNFNLFESKEKKKLVNKNLIKNVLNKYIYTMKSFEVKNKGNIEDNNDNYFLLENVKEGDNNFVINIPNISFKHESSINSIQNKI